jgi:hypothetical protein
MSELGGNMPGSVPPGSYAARVRRELRTRCVHLRTKAAFFPIPGDDERPNPYGTAIWWCDRTCEALGPDGSAAHPDGCDAPGRPCHDAPGRAVRPA